MNQAVWYNQWTFKLFKKYISGRILEVGCGIGSFTRMLSEHNNVYAIDIEKTYIDATKNITNVHVGFGDIEKGIYFFKNETFQTLICLNVLEHIENDTKALQNMFELLTSGGRLILLVPSHQFLYGKIDKAIGHFRRYRKKHLRKKLEKIGFQIEFSKRINSLGALGWLLNGRVLHEQVVDQKKLKLFEKIAPYVLPLENIIEPPIGTSILFVAQKN